MAASDLTPHQEWFTTLDAEQRLDAHECLLAGTYSRTLLNSLRVAIPTSPDVHLGLDDPHTAQAGDPLGAGLQTFLREQYLTPLHAALHL
jgi:streptomycin 6-kinase